MADSLITVKLTPKSARNTVVGWEKDVDENDVLKCCVTAVPEKGKANKALILLLSKEWGIPKSSIQIIRGETDRIKTLTIHNFNPRDFV